MVSDGDTPFLNGSDSMASSIPGATTVVVPQAGHGANVAQPAMVHQTLRHFLAQR